MAGKTTNFLVYKDGNELIGVADVELPELKKVVAETKGGGYLGKSSSPITGHFEELTTKIEFEELMSETLDLVGAKEVSLTFKANVTGLDRDKGLKVRIRGVAKGFTLGKLTAAEALGQAIEIETDYIKVTVAGKEKFELDKANFVYKVDGKDLLVDAKKNIGK